uniref:Reverse transcriptase domain-containing protein n=1 Tax=Labrus bergylta TaxID=56723 RepID=A0A3Q3EML5_9LABR
MQERRRRKNKLKGRRMRERTGEEGERTEGEGGERALQTGEGGERVKGGEGKISVLAPVLVQAGQSATTRRGFFSTNIRTINSYVGAIQRLLQRRSFRTPYMAVQRRTRRAKQREAKGGRKGRACPLYKITQERLLADRSAAARWILDGMEKVACSIDKGVIVSAYKKVWGGGRFAALPAADNAPLQCSFSPAEVLRALKTMNSGSAPGPDRIQKMDLLKWNPKGVKLADLFNAIVLSGRLPACLRGSHTTLIPKSSGGSIQRDIAKWQPITIGSVILRTLSSVLTSQLTEVCTLHPRQRGFIPTPGCSENVKNGGSLACVFIDLSNAFDLVCHAHLAEVLDKRGVDETLRNFITDSYKQCFTRIKSESGLTGKIRLHRGVKQGDSMSPLLFNLAIDPLFLSSLAFVDDLVLLSDSWDGMSGNLAILNKFCQLSGLRVNLAKSHGFLIEKRGKTKISVNNCPPWCIAATPIHMVGVGKTVTYLGIQIKPLKGVARPDLRSKVLLILVVSAATLLPKLLELVKLTIGSSAGVDGGSGSDTFTVNPPPVSSSAWRHAEFDRWSKLSSQGFNVSVFRDDRISNAWLCSQAERLRFESETITALKLRSNVMPTLVSGTRGRPTAQNILSCRLCKSHRETMRHIVSSCPGLQKNRIRNHNNICELLANEATRRGWSVDREKRMTTPAGTVGVPDRLMRKGPLAIIADVAIGFEGSDETLSDLANCKFHKYRPFAKVVRGHYPILKRVRVQGFPIGARGKWHGPNGSLLGVLGLSKSQNTSFAKLLSKRVLLFTIDLIRTFFKIIRSK